MGLFVGFAWHWFGLRATKVSFAPTSGHTCQMLREFDSLRAVKSYVIDSYSRSGIGIQLALSWLSEAAAS
jgi:hypothetical protein